MEKFLIEIAANRIGDDKQSYEGTVEYHYLHRGRIDLLPGLVIMSRSVSYLDWSDLGYPILRPPLRVSAIHQSPIRADLFGLLDVTLWEAHPAPVSQMDCYMME